MANALQQQMADDIASLVRKQTFAGSGVWRQSGNATLRIETQTDSLVNALQRLPSREEQEEEERESDREHAEIIDALTTEPTSSGETTKKKGILGSLFGGLGKLGKSLGAIGKGALGFGKLGLKGITKSLGFLFTALKIIAGPLVLLGGLLFLTMDEKKREATIKTIVNALNSAFNFVSMLGNAFKGGFLEGYNEEGGLKDSLKEFADAWGLVFDSISETVFIPDAGKGLTGIFNWLGKQLASFAKGLVDIGTGIAKIIKDPGQQIAVLQVAVENFFTDIVDTVSGFFGEVFSIKGLTKILEFMLGREIPFLSKMAGERDIKQQQTRIAQLTDENVELDEKIEGAKNTQLKAETEEEKYLANLAIQRFEAQKARNISAIERSEDSIRESAKMAAAENIQTRMQSELGFDKGLYDTRKAKLQRDIDENFGDKINVGGMSGRELEPEKVMSLLNQALKMEGSGIAKNNLGQEILNLSPQARGALESIGFDMDVVDAVYRQAKMQTAGIRGAKKQLAEMEAQVATISKTQRKTITDQEVDKVLQRLAPNLHQGGYISEGGLANVATGEMMMDNFAAEQALKAANIIQSYLPQSGATINGLQMDRTMGGTMGSIAPVVIDNSQQPTIINQTNVAAPQTRGPALVGEGRDKVNMR